MKSRPLKNPAKKQRKRTQVDRRSAGIHRKDIRSRNRTARPGGTGGRMACLNACNPGRPRARP